MLTSVNNLVQWIHSNVRYERRFTSVNTTAADVLASMRGVCRDRGHICLAMLRVLGIPARYVSGRLTRQTGETHAWTGSLRPILGCLPADALNLLHSSHAVT